MQFNIDNGSPNVFLVNSFCTLYSYNIEAFDVKSNKMASAINCCRRTIPSR